MATILLDTYKKTYRGKHRTSIWSTQKTAVLATILLATFKNRQKVLDAALRPGQTHATFQRKVLQHCCEQCVAHFWPPCSNTL